MKANWIAIPALAAALAFAGAVQGGPAKAETMAGMDVSAKKGGQGKGHAKGHAKAHKVHKTKWHGAYVYRDRGANSPYFCPPGQAKKPGLGSAHMC